MQPLFVKVSNYVVTCICNHERQVQYFKGNYLVISISMARNARNVHDTVHQLCCLNQKTSFKNADDLSQFSEIFGISFPTNGLFDLSKAIIRKGFLIHIHIETERYPLVIVDHDKFLNVHQILFYCGCNVRQKMVSHQKTCHLLSLCEKVLKKRG